MNGFLDFLHHLLIPRSSNNHRAKILHHSSLTILIALVLFGQLLLNVTEEKFSSVLGISHSITVDELLNQTNQKRQEAGLASLSLDAELSQAAAQKAQHMFANNYWAHNAPDGTTPWVFIKASGYEYLYAGENLARGYTSSVDTVNAWMASQGHKDNIVSGNYKDIGFAVLTGTLDGEETVLVVQMFGSKNAAVANATQSVVVPTPIPSITAAPLAVLPTRIPLLTATPQPTVAPTLAIAPTAIPQGNTVASIQSRPLINSKTLSKDIAIGIVGFLIIVLVVDLVIIERKKIARIVAHNIDHIIFLSIILIAIFIFTRGVIL